MALGLLEESGSNCSGRFSNTVLLGAQISGFEQQPCQNGLLLEGRCPQRSLRWQFDRLEVKPVNLI